jgi:hypothetical protein
VFIQNHSICFPSSARVRSLFMNRDTDLNHSNNSSDTKELHQKPDISLTNTNDGIFAYYRRRGKSPSGEIDGVYNITHSGNVNIPITIVIVKHIGK